MPTANEPISHREPWRIPAWLGLCLFLAIAAFFLWEEHRAHLLGALPYVLLLLCPVIHLFMHRGQQYVAFIVIMFGFLLQWPTLVTLVMCPILVWVYARLARREERDVRAQFGVVWDAYAGRIPAFIPRLRRRQQAV